MRKTHLSPSFLPPGSGRMEKRRTTIIANIFHIMASLSCASILCAVVLLITNGSIRHAVFVVDFRGGFPWRIFVPDFAADLPADFRGRFAGGILRLIYSGPKPCKLHIKIESKIHHKNPPHSSPHARLVCDYTLPAFFTACFAACPSTGILHYVTYTADFFRGGFLPRHIFAWRISSAADFFRGGFLLRLQVAICH